MASRGPRNPQQNRRGRGGGGNAAGVNQGLRKPVFVKVDQLKPGTYGHTLTVKVLDANTVLSKKPRNPTSFRAPPLQQQQPTRIAECLVGDDTGTILFTARNDQGIPISLLLNFFSRGSMSGLSSKTFLFLSVGVVQFCSRVGTGKY